MVEVDHGLSATLTERFGDSLRVVATHEEDDYEFLYRSDAVTESYTTEEFTDIFRDFVLEGMDREHVEGLFHVGDLQCAAWGFEEAVIFYFPGEGFSGLAVSVGRDGSVDADDLIETCKAALRDGSPD